jgi:hypothetical protein
METNLESIPMKKLEPSTWLWNGIAVAAFTVITSFYPDAGFVIWGFSNILALAIIIDGESDNHLWICLTGLAWSLAAFAGMVLLGQLAFSQIAKFNDWFNERLTKKQKSNESSDSDNKKQNQ